MPMTISVMTVLSAHVHPGKRSGTTYSIVKPSKGAPMSLVGPLPDKASGMTVSIAATLRMRNLPLQQCHKHRVLRLAHTVKRQRLASVRLWWTTAHVSRAWSLPHTFIIPYSNAPEHISKGHRNAAMQLPWASCMSYEWWTAGPMISQTVLYSDCSSFHASCRVEAVTMSFPTVIYVPSESPITPQPPGPLWLCTDPRSYSSLAAQSRLISNVNPHRSQAFVSGIMLAQLTTTTPYLHEQSCRMEDQNRRFKDSEANPAEGSTRSFFDG
ncbi:hypothetical protein EDD15DRAFT_2469761 [Pisolithus albus]|nr:hypothetical protein EDD15DRAFT_2469761 [Pisolithus albus]